MHYYSPFSRAHGLGAHGHGLGVCVGHGLRVCVGRPRDNFFLFVLFGLLNIKKLTLYNIYTCI